MFFNRSYIDGIGGTWYYDTGVAAFCGEVVEFVKAKSRTVPVFRNRVFRGGLF